ncbi:hypothetical protein KR018_010972 [Drosophila ironensis]|nr:hypothetical protein KR018_010972 [Drosophila ironensis]
MVYANMLLGLGVVLFAAAAAIYFSMPNFQQTAPHYNASRSRREEEEEMDNNDPRNLRRHLTQQQMRCSRPGDLCSVCLDEMQQLDMHMMVCGHALHKICYGEFRYVRRNCILCSRVVNPSLPGDDCPICLDPLRKEDMSLLPCQHAQHSDCLTQFRASGAKVCPICRKSV